MLGAKSKKKRVLKLFLISLIFVFIAAVIAVVAYNYILNRDFKESFYSVGSLKTNNKIRVVQISDLHSCVYGENNSEIVNRVKKLNPDLIIYTGDIADADAESTDGVVNLCAALSDVAPSYYIYGNNEVERIYGIPLTLDELDKKFGFNNENRNPETLLMQKDDLEEKLEAAGVKVLKNEMATVTIGETDVDIFGVLTSNPSSFWPYAGERFDRYLNTNKNNLKITAIHEPLVFEKYTPDTWGDVLIAGHTHGGVAKIPMIGPIYTGDGGLLPERNGHFVYGRYDVKGSPMVVSSGLENKNIFRINNQPEIAIVDINKF